MEAILSRLETDSKAAEGLQYNLVHLNGDNKDEITLIEAQVERNSRKILRLREAFLAGADSVEEYKSMKESLESEARELEERLGETKMQIDTKKAAKQMRASISDTLKILRSVKATKEEKYNAAHNTIEKCVWDKDKNTIKTALPPIFLSPYYR